MCCILAYRKMLTKDQVRNQDPGPYLEDPGPNEDPVPKILFTGGIRALWQIREQELLFKLLFITFLGKIGSNLRFVGSISKNEGRIWMHIVRRLMLFSYIKIFLSKTAMPIVLQKVFL